MPLCAGFPKELEGWKLKLHPNTMRCEMYYPLTLFPKGQGPAAFKVCPARRHAVSRTIRAQCDTLFGKDSLGPELLRRVNAVFALLPLSAEIDKSIPSLGPTTRARSPFKRTPW